MVTRYVTTTIGYSLLDLAGCRPETGRGGSPFPVYPSPFNDIITARCKLFFSGCRGS